MTVNIGHAFTIVVISGQANRQMLQVVHQIVLRRGLPENASLSRLVDQLAVRSFSDALRHELALPYRHHYRAFGRGRHLDREEH
jgi:hypothetical protein